MIRIWTFMAMDNRQAEAYLEKQAAKGYHLSWHGDFLAHFDKGLPKKVKYCISSFTWEVEDELEAYKVMAQDAGWNFVDEMQGGCIFVSKENEEPVPLYTDWRDECRLTRKSVWNRELAIFSSFFLDAVCLILFALLKLHGSTMWWTINLICACAIVYLGSGIIRSGWYMVAVTIALRKDEPPREKVRGIERIVNYVRAVIYYITAFAIVMIGLYYLLGKIIPALLRILAAGNFYAWSITIVLALLVGIFILYVFIEEKHQKAATAIKWIMAGLLLLLTPVVIAACVDA